MAMATQTLVKTLYSCSVSTETRSADAVAALADDIERLDEEPLLGHP